MSEHRRITKIKPNQTCKGAEGADERWQKSAAYNAAHPLPPVSQLSRQVRRRNLIRAFRKSKANQVAIKQMRGRHCGLVKAIREA